MRVLLTATDEYEEAGIRIPGDYPAKGYAEEATDIACPANLPKLTVADLRCWVRCKAQQAAAGDGSGSTEVTGKGDPIWPDGPFWQKNKKDGMRYLTRGENTKPFNSEAVLHQAKEDVVVHAGQ